jgi:hypothetical protein
MDETANDVVSPRFVIASEGLRTELLDAIGDTGVNSVVPDTSLGLLGADSLDGAVHERGAGKIRPGNDSREEIEGREPGVVIEDRAFCVEAPKCDLGRMV